MKRFVSLLLTSLTLLTLQAQISPEALRTWHSNKFSLFIHFGLYSQAGGVWNGQPVTRGYSEQIQAFAPIPPKEYHALAQTFNPDQFHADSIVALAQAAGMRSIIFTTKHHDGFCLFRTETTPYNSYHATPGKRDFVKELSEACQKKGINFGLYYSLIDWSFPEASPMSGHNPTLFRLRIMRSPRNNSLSYSPTTEKFQNCGLIWEPILPNKAGNFISWCTSSNPTAWSADDWEMISTTFV